MPKPTPPKSILGRTIVFLVFYGSAVFLAMAIIIGLAQSLYGNPPATTGETVALSSQEHSWCLRSVVGLKEELSAQLTLELHHPRPPSAHAKAPLQRWARWHEGWLAKYAQADARCAHAGDEKLTAAFGLLGALNEVYKTGVEGLLGEGTALRAELEQAVKDLRRHRSDP